jgi:hypothetical protein
MAGGDDAFTGPRFTHDCTKCAFLATHEYEEEGHRYDFYFCTAQIGHIPTVIARFSDEGRDYLSGLEIGQRQDIDMPLGLAYALARERGFTK